MICALTIIINLTQYPMTPRDLGVLTDAKIRCEELYVESPCVIKFAKTDKHSYQVTCGRELT